jgi:hypothetical protein
MFTAPYQVLYTRACRREQLGHLSREGEGGGTDFAPASAAVLDLFDLRQQAALCDATASVARVDRFTCCVVLARHESFS